MSISINVTLSPHITQGKPRGYYLIAHDLFPRGTPTLGKHQWLGYSNGLIVTADHNYRWDSLLKMAIHCSQIAGKPVTWLAKAKIWPTSKGFRSYIPGSILKPKSAEANHTTTTGFFDHDRPEPETIYYLHLPEVNGGILLGRKEL